MHNLYTLQEASFYLSTHHKLFSKFLKENMRCCFGTSKHVPRINQKISELDTTPIYFRRISRSDKGT